MNFYTVLFALAAIYISSSNGCSRQDYSPLPIFDFLGNWVTYQKAENPAENPSQKDSKCIFYELSVNETVPGFFVDLATFIADDDSRSTLKGDATLPDVNTALVHIDWPDSSEMFLHAVSTNDESTYIILRDCIDDEGNLIWCSFLFNFYLI